MTPQGQDEPKHVDGQETEEELPVPLRQCEVVVPALRSGARLTPD